MAPKRTPNPGKTAQFYRNNPKAYRKKLAENKRRNAKPENKAYRRQLAIARREEGIMGKGGPDMSHRKDGSLFKEDPKKNRARNRGRK